MTGRNKKILVTIVAVAFVAVVVVIFSDYRKYKQGVSSFFFHTRSTYSQSETLQFGDISVYLTRARIIKDKNPDFYSEVDVNFMVHNNTSNTVNLAPYNFQVSANQAYAYIDQNSFQKGYIAPNSSQQNYFVAHIDGGYTKPFTLVVSKRGVIKSIVINSPEIAVSPS